MFGLFVPMTETPNWISSGILDGHDFSFEIMRLVMDTFLLSFKIVLRLKSDD